MIYYINLPESLHEVMTLNKGTIKKRARKLAQKSSRSDDPGLDYQYVRFFNDNHIIIMV